MSRSLLLFFCVLSPCWSLNILGLFPHPVKSHWDVFEPLLKELAVRGHNLTIIGHFPLKTPLPGYNDISLRGDTDILLNFINVEELPKSRYIYYFSPILLSILAKENCKGLRTKQMQEFKNSNQKFDLIITETFNTDCFLGFVHKYQVPFIGLSSCTVMPWSNTRFGNPVNPSCIPVSFLQFSDRMSFLERVENTVNYIYSAIIFRFLMDEPGYVEAKKYFGDDLPPLTDISNNISLMLVNSHFSLNLPRPLVPNIVEVGGMFLGKPKKLPQNLEKYINDSPDGVIYFSMGSMIKAYTFPEERRKAFLGAFGKLKQRVLWKWDNTMPDKPENVMTQPWMPQYDILCHPNVVAFISHGGLLGTTEAVQCGVPIIVMPQFGDQFTNARAVEAVGAGVLLNLADVIEENVTNALNIVLEPSFKRKAESVSARFQDRPQSPMDTAVFWVEYVGRHGGAHMRSAGDDMPLYHVHIVGFLLFVAGLLVTAGFLLVRAMWRGLTGRCKSKAEGAVTGTTELPSVHA